MPSCRVWIFGCAAFLASQSADSLAQQGTVGNVTAAKNSVQSVVGAHTGSISGGTKVYTNELLRTGESSSADLRILNDSTSTFGPLSEARLGKFVYDPGESGALVIEATKGSFRFVTGKEGEKAYQIKTPYGTVDIRG
jgi:hypothetical protein